MSIHVVYNQKGVLNIVIVIALIGITYIFCVVSLIEACSLVQKEGGLVAYPKLRRGLGAHEGGSWV